MHRFYSLVIFSLVCFTAYPQQIIIDENTAVNPVNPSSGFINSDEFPDVVYSSYYGYGNTWLKNLDSAGEHFLPVNISNENVYTSSMQIADCDDDGDGDLIFINYSDLFKGLSVLENTDGEGTVWEFHYFGVVTDYYPILQAITDIDNDGDLDAVVSDYGENTIYWCENSGGNYSTRHMIAEEYVYVISLCVADLDNDSDNDIISLGYLTEITVFKNTDGAGSFLADTLIDTYSNLTIVKSGDMNNDGFEDLILGGDNSFAYPSLIWYPNSGDGIFTSDITIDDGTGDYTSINISDADGDADQDIIRSKKDADDVTKISYLKNQSDGSDFSVEQLIDYSLAYSIKFSIRDFNFDNLPDIVSADYEAVKMYINNYPADTFSVPFEMVSHTTTWKVLFEMDVENDSDIDLVMEDILGRIYWYEFDIETSSFIAKHTISSDTMESPFYSLKLTHHDINGDSLEDLFLCYKDNDDNYYTVCLKNLGSGIFSEPVLVNDKHTRKIWFSDIDLDGDDDVITFGDDIFWNYNTDGEGTFGPTSILSVYEIGIYNLFDFDNDGDEDIIGYNAGPDFDLWGVVDFENTGGTFSDEQPLAWSCGAPDYINHLDFDSDGDEDILVVCDGWDYATENIYYCENISGNYDDAYTQYGTIGGMPGYGYTKLLDINADGLQDLVYTTDYYSPGYFMPQTNYSLNNGLGFGDSWHFSDDYGLFADFDQAGSMDYAGYDKQKIYWIQNAVPVFPDFNASVATHIVSESGLIDTLLLTFGNIPSDTITLEISVDNDLDIGAGAGNSIDIVINPDISALDTIVIFVSTFDDALLEGYHADSIHIRHLEGLDVYASVLSFDFVEGVIDNDIAPGLSVDFSKDYLNEGSSGYLEINLTTLPTDFVTLTMTTDTQIYFSPWPVTMTVFDPDLSCFDVQDFLIDSYVDEFNEGVHYGYVYFSLSSEDPVYDALYVDSFKIEIRDHYTAIDQNNYDNHLTIYPNPAKNNFNISFRSFEESGDVQIEIINSIGEIIQSENDLLINGELNTKIIFNDKMKTGIYTVRLITDHLTESIQLLMLE